MFEDAQRIVFYCFIMHYKNMTFFVIFAACFFQAKYRCWPQTVDASRSVMFQSTWEKLFHRKRIVKHDRKIKFTTKISKLEAGGKPSTRFPPERLVEHIITWAARTKTPEQGQGLKPDPDPDPDPQARERAPASGSRSGLRPRQRPQRTWF